jgi:hypothetical protein
MLVILPFRNTTALLPCPLDNSSTASSANRLAKSLLLDRSGWILHYEKNRSSTSFTSQICHIDGKTDFTLVASVGYSNVTLTAETVMEKKR